MNKSKKTIFCDIDGTLIRHFGGLYEQVTRRPELLEGTIEKLDEWDRAGHNIILVTGRRESTRQRTEEQLNMLGIFYDQLIMGLGGYERVVVNDLKSDSRTPTASCHCVKRNYGIKDIEV
tara:strand:+ start:367 stop:726 length:360 start_codon:yes stop_codon:yes gene_type:complete